MSGDGNPENVVGDELRDHSETADDAMNPAQSSTGKRDAFIAFQGGGAKGLAHVGALHALKKISGELLPNGKDIHVVGVAGTSAGAIVAALYAAGYTATDMIDTHLERHLLKLKELRGLGCKTAIDLIGKKNWTSVKSFRRLMDFGVWYAALFLGVLVYAIGHAVNGLSPAPAGVAALVLILYFFWQIHRASMGFAEVGDVKKAMDYVLRVRVHGKDSEERVRFKDFGGSTGRPALKIIATDITNRRMKLFSPETTPYTPVADAVAASICIPAVFKPWRIEDFDAEFLDGGLVSNLPAWPFDEERLLNPTALTLAFEIVDHKDEVKKKGLISRCLAGLWRIIRGPRGHWLAPAISTAIFGANQLNKRAVGEIEVLELDISLGLLAFDASEDEIYEQVGQVAGYAETQLRTALIKIPGLMQKSADSIHQAVEKILKPVMPLIAPAGPVPPRVRVAVMIQDQSAHRSYQAKYCAGYEPLDPDLNIIIPAEGSYVGAAQARKSALFTHVVPGLGPTAYGKFANASELKRMESLAWPDMGWCYCIPTDKNHLPKRWKHVVVAIDGNHDFTGLDQGLIDKLMNKIQQGVEIAMLDSFKSIAG